MAHPRSKFPPLLLLVVSFVLVGLLGYQTLRDRKISADLLKQKDLHIEKLEGRLEREKKRSLQLQEKLTRLTSQKEQLHGLKEGLSGQLIEMQRVKSTTEDEKKRLESSLKDKESEVFELKEKLGLLQGQDEELKLMKDEMIQKDVEIKELRAQLKLTQAMASTSSITLNGDALNQVGPADKGSETSNDEKSTQGNVEEKSSVRDGDSESSKDLIGGGINDNSTEKRENLEEETEDKHEEKAAAGEEIHEKVEEEEHQASKENDGRDDTELEDELKVDDREEPLAEDATEHEEAEKAHDEEDTEEQPDVDIEAVNKSSLEDNEMAAMEK